MPPQPTYLQKLDAVVILLKTSGLPFSINTDQFRKMFVRVKKLVLEDCSKITVRLSIIQQFEVKFSKIAVN
jgi:hypothetical protein